MKYYQNNVTDEIIGVENMRELISFPTDSSINAGYVGYSYTVIYDMICPNKILGNGIKTYCITWAYLKKYYRRINAKIALQKYPEFKQYRFADLPMVPQEERLEIMGQQTF